MATDEQRALAPALWCGLALALCAACGGSTASAPQVAVHLQPGAGVQQLAAAAAARGYPAVVMQPELGRFGVLAHYGRRTGDVAEYRFAVECQAAVCLVSPYGPRTERRADGWLLPPELRDELLDFQAALQSASTMAVR